MYNGKIKGTGADKMAYKFEKKLKEIIVLCGEAVDINKIDANTDLVKDFEFSSINIIQLVVEIESIFEVEIEDENLFLEKLSNYSNLVNILRTKLNE